MKAYITCGMIRNILVAPSSLDAALIFLERYHQQNCRSELDEMIQVSEAGYEWHEEDELFYTSAIDCLYRSLQEKPEEQ